MSWKNNKYKINIDCNNKDFIIASSDMEIIPITKKISNNYKIIKTKIKEYKIIILITIWSISLFSWWYMFLIYLQNNI